MGVWLTSFRKFCLFVCLFFFFFFCFLQGATLIGPSQKIWEHCLIYNHGGASFLLTFIHCDI
jgi:hypothetical protein